MTTSLRSYTYHTVLFTDNSDGLNTTLPQTTLLTRSCLQDVPQWRVM